MNDPHHHQQQQQQQQPKTNGKDIARIKQEKYELKQRRKIELQQKNKSERDFVERHSSFVTWLCMDDVKRVREQRDQERMKRLGMNDDSQKWNQKQGKRKRKRRVNYDSSNSKSNEDSCYHNDTINAVTMGNDGTRNSSVSSKLNDLIGPFLDLKDKNNNMDEYKDENGRRIFIAEGTETVRLLIQRCRHPSMHSSRHDKRNGNDYEDGNEYEYKHDIVSILTKPTTFFNDPVNLLKTIKEIFPSYFSRNKDDNKDFNDNNDMMKQGHQFPFHIFIGAENILTEIAGFHISRGAIGCGIIPHLDESWLYSYLLKKTKRLQSSNGNNQQQQQIRPCDKNLSAQIPSLQHNQNKKNIRILALDQVSDTANLGSLIRSSAAFGIDCILLSHDSCDAWYRRSVRVSMGHVLTVPTIRVQDMGTTITTLKKKFGITSYAAVVDDDHIDDCTNGCNSGNENVDSDTTNRNVVLEKMGKAQIDPFWCCVLGNEGNGITSDTLRSCTFRIRIGMADNVDSLSIGVACGILLHGMREREKKLS